MGFTKNTGTYSKPSGGIPASDLASGVIPTALKNPKALTFSGAVTGTYDGSEAKTVNIPSAFTMTVGTSSGSYNIWFDTN